MYGMIHRAARTMAMDVLGERAWLELAAAAGLDEDHFLSSHVYSDESTLALVAAIADRAGLTVPAALHAFGRFWITYADASAYGSIMRMSGDTLPEFLANLDRMHATIQRVMPETRMPSFHVASANAHGIEVLYQSDRTGMEPFVAGLMEGLMDKFALTGAVTYAPDADGVMFLLSHADVDAKAA